MLCHYLLFIYALYVYYSRLIPQSLDTNKSNKNNKKNKNKMSNDSR